MRSQRSAVQPLAVLCGSVLHYDNPVDPIEERAWEAPQHGTRNEDAHADTSIETPR
ncbi:prevent-host-death protein [Burkholderia lata]|nr:prevent-host-death protein [Burkholderia lata]